MCAMKRTIAVLSLLLLAGCGAGTPATTPTPVDTQAANEAAFLTKLHQDGKNWVTSDAKSVEIGYAVCKRLRTGTARPEDGPLWAAMQYSTYDSSSVAAIYAPMLCPDWARG